jgi:hypothetical protein
MNSPDERRIAARVKVEMAVAFSYDGKPAVPGKIENISRSGVLLTSDIPVRQSAKVTITFTDPTTQLSHAVEGEVVRSVAAGKAGVAFVNIEQNVIDFLKRIVDGPL